MIVGQTARADANVRLDDLPGTSGRLDIMARCARAALCVSHGIRANVVVHLVLLGGKRPVSVRIDGPSAKFVRPDERALATMMIKAVARHPEEANGYVAQRNGISVAWDGLEAAIADSKGPSYVLDEGGADVRSTIVPEGVYFIGDHLGFDGATRARLSALGPRAVSVGPLSLHSDDVVTLVSNELDRVTSSP